MTGRKEASEAAGVEEAEVAERGADVVPAALHRAGSVEPLELQPEAGAAGAGAVLGPGAASGKITSANEFGCPRFGSHKISLICPDIHLHRWGLPTTSHQCRSPPVQDEFVMLVLFLFLLPRRER